MIHVTHAQVKRLKTGKAAGRPGAKAAGKAAANKSKAAALKLPEEDEEAALAALRAQEGIEAPGTGLDCCSVVQ